MEVHHHSHTAPAHGGTGMKKWTHYFWEFFMLFLAVTLGFFVENQREHMMDHQRERIFMSSMIEDVIKDSFMLARTEKNSKSAADHIDTMLYILQNLKLDDSSLVVLYRANLRSLQFFGPAFTDRTSSQLKNSGAMRLIRNRDVADSIINYWSQADLIIKANEIAEEYKLRARDKSYSIFDQKYYTYSEGKGTHINTLHPKLMTKNVEELTELSNRLSHIRTFIRAQYIPSIYTQKQIGTNLIKIIKTEYHLD